MTSVEQNTRANLVPVKDMNPMNRNFDCEVIVVQKESEPTRTREGDLISRFIVADRTASIVLSVWGDQGSDIRSGDILRLTGVDNKVRKGQLYLSTPKHCKIRRVGQDTFPFVEKPNMSDTEYPQNSYNNNMNNASNSNNWNKNQQQQTQPNRIPANNNNNMNSTINNNNNNSNINSNRVIRGYQHNNNANEMNHPYRNRPQHQRGGFHNSNNNRGRGRGNFNNNSGNRYHRDLDNPV